MKPPLRWLWDHQGRCAVGGWERRLEKAQGSKSLMRESACWSGGGWMGAGTSKRGQGRIWWGPRGLPFLQGTRVCLRPWCPCTGNQEFWEPLILSEDFVCPFKDLIPPLSIVYSIHITSLTISPLFHQLSSRLFFSLPVFSCLLLDFPSSSENRGSELSPLPHWSPVGIRGSPHSSGYANHHLHGITRPTFPCYATFTQACISREINYCLIAVKTFTTLIYNSVAIHMTLLLNAVNSELFGWALIGTEWMWCQKATSSLGSRHKLTLFWGLHLKCVELDKCLLNKWKMVILYLINIH